MRAPILCEPVVGREPENNITETQRQTVMVPNQRQQTRYNLHLPTALRRLSNPQWFRLVRTANISSGGVLFVLDGQWGREFELGDACQLEIELIPASSRQDRVLLLCRGPIVRIVLESESLPSVQAAVKIAYWKIVRK